jgi:uracil-DNA glycosylase
MKRVAITQYFQAAKRTVASSSAKDSTPDATLVKSSMAVAANKSEDGEVAVSSVTEWVALAAVPESWRDFFEKESSKPYFKVLTGFVRTEQSKHTVYPPEAEIFTAFKLSPLDRVRVVIIGQDPYHGA